jgi:hypothetical protein
MNLIEEHMNETIPIKTWRAACASSRESNHVCGMILLAAGLVDLADDTLVDVSTDGNEYVEAFFASSEEFEQEGDSALTPEPKASTENRQRAR